MEFRRQHMGLYPFKGLLLRGDGRLARPRPQKW